MRIRAIRLRGAGPFASGVALEGLSGALDVLSGPNEFGKSTLFRGLEAVFLSKHTRGGDWLERLKSRGAAEMTIEADFEAANASWRILKRFGRGATAELTRLETGQQEARRQEADERLAELIGSHPDEPGKLGLLWVGQGRALRPIEPDADKDRGERSALMAAIEREVTAVAAGAEARIVRERVARLLDEQTTPANRARARKNSPYEQAVRRRDELAAALDVARRNAEQTTARRDEMARLRERLQVLDDSRARACRAERLASAETALAAASRAVAEQRAAQAARNEKAQAQENAEAALQAFDHRLQELADVAAAMEQDRSRLAAAQEALRAGNDACTQVRTRLTDLDAEERKAAQHIAALRAAEARERLAAAMAIATRIREADAALAANPLTPEKLHGLEREERAISLLEAQLAAAAPRVRIDYANGGGGRIRLAGKPVADQSEILAEGPIVLDIDGVGRITISPGTDTGADDDRKSLTSHREELAAGLATLAVTSLAEARQRADDRRRAEQALREAKAELAGIAPQGLSALSREVERAFAGSDRSDVAPASGTLAEAEAAMADARRRLEAARADLAKAESAHGAAKTQAGRIAATIEAQEQRLAAIAARLPPPAVRQEERARLANAAAEAAREAREAARALAAVLETVQSGPALARLQAEHEAAKRDYEKAEAEAGDLKQQAARIEGALEEADEKGAGTEVERLSGEMSRAQADVRRHRARVEALALLEVVLGEAEAATRDRFLAPVTARLAPFLALAFPEAHLVLGERFTVKALERSGISEAIDALSQGTQEQIAVLVRCAFGRLLAEAATPAPLILDDALVYSDDLRIERMFAALALSAEAHQVLVLTCRERTFERLGGHRLSLTQWNG